MQAFLGLINFDREFVPNLADLTKSYYNCINVKTQEIKWTADMEKAFDNVKKLWSEELSLRMPDYTKKCVLETDASDIGLGCVLKQDDRIIYCLSRVLKGEEPHYSITEKELLAALWGWKNEVLIELVVNSF